MKHLLIWIFFATTTLNSCQFTPKTRNENNSNTIISESDKEDSIFNVEIAESNRKFKINDSMAIALVRKVKEINHIIDYKYEDTTIFNEINIDNVPSENDINWKINIRQVQPRIEHSISLMWILVNAKTGDISIFDVPKDTIISLDTWLKGLPK